MKICEQPFGLPKGTVRAALALLLVGGSLYMWATVGDIPESLAVLDGMVIRDYFEARKNEESS